MEQRKLRRGDVVELPIPDLFLPARVWRRIDDHHVQVIDSFQHISIYRDEHLKLSDYKGHWAWQRHPGNDYGHHTKWVPMTSLRRMKNYARRYNAHFGGISGYGHKRTRQDRLKALADRKVSLPGLLITDIVWDKEVNGVEQDVTLPKVLILRDTTEEDVADKLSDQFGYCIKSFVVSDKPPFPGYKQKD